MAQKAQQPLRMGNMSKQRRYIGRNNGRATRCPTPQQPMPQQPDAITKTPGTWPGASTNVVFGKLVYFSDSAGISPSFTFKLAETISALESTLPT